MRWKEWRDEDHSGGKGVLKGMSDGGRNERKEGEVSDGMGEGIGRLLRIQEG